MNRGVKTAVLIPLLIILFLVLIGLASAVGAFLLYFYGGGFSNKLSTESQDWGAFGSYFGGVLAPIVGLLSMAILGYTLLQQQSQILLQFRENIKQDQLRNVNHAQETLYRLLQKEVELSSGLKVQLGDLVDQIVDGEVANVKFYSAPLKRLLTAQQQYFHSLMLYKGNVDTYFVFEAHSRRLKEIQSFLVKNSRFMDHWDRVNVGVLGGFIEHAVF